MATRPRGQIEPLHTDPPTFRVRIFTGRTAEGKRQYRTVGTYRTVKQAQSARDRALTEQDTGSFVAPSKVLLRDYLTQWLAGLLSDVDATKRGYAERVKLITAHLGHLRLDHLTRDAIKAFYSTLQEAGKSARTIQYTHQTLRLALSEAVLSRRLARNPTDKIKLPAPDRRKAALTMVFTGAETDTFLAHSQAHGKYLEYPLFYTLLHTGMRPSEAAGLQWNDFDADKAELQVKRVVDTGGVQERAKTDQSRRTIKLTAEHVAVLQAHRQAQRKVMLEAGPAYDRAAGFVFAEARTGAHLPMKQWLRSRWKRACLEAKVPVIRPYGARHTHATRLLEANVNPKLVAERLGNSPEIVMSVYSHVLPSARDAVVEALERQQAGR